MNEPLAPGSKRRRLRGSCDFCKQRKIRCDSAQRPGNHCSNCIAFNAECTHDLKSAPKKSGHSKTPPYQSPDISVTTVKEHVAAIVTQATSYIRDDEVRRVLLDVARYARSLENDLATRSRSPSVPTSSSAAASPASQLSIKEVDDSDLYVDGMLAERFDRFRLDSDFNRYYGKSSHFDLISKAIDIKKKLVEDPSQPKSDLPPAKRHQFWMSPWEHAHLSVVGPMPLLEFPEPDLLRGLVDLYFLRVNIVVNLLHRPTFERSLASGLHLVDPHFGETVLGVCCVAAKFSDDPRVILEGTNTRLSSGWKYYRQLKPFQKSLIRSISLYEAQTLCLCVIYMQGGSTPDMCWSLSGAGIRYAQELGVHRRNRYDNKVLDEQWKRVFWVLVCIDTLVSSFCGRPRSTSAEDYDLDYPADCDDEYWETEDPCMAFKQPPGKPSTVAYMGAYLKLIEILGMAQDTIYLVNARNKSDEWTRDAVANLDSALNAWADSIPDQLRWDPNREDSIFSTQSVVLYASYYHVQIQVHRIFIVSPCRKTWVSCPMPYNYPSLAICASSARACSHVMDVASRRGWVCNPHVLNAVFDSCLVLLLHVWGGRKVGLAVDPKKCMQDIDICLRAFRAYETRWQAAGRQHDIITELMSAANMDGAYAPNPLKRVRGQDHEPEPAPSAGTNGAAHPYSAATADASDGSLVFTPPAPDIDTDPLFVLPLYTEDLGRLPVYEPLNWNADSWGKAADDGVLVPNIGVGAPFVPAGPTFLDPGVEDSVLGMSADSLAVFTGAPGGYDWDEWGKYITTVEELMSSLDGSTGVR
ncbi:fungal-specific transcription factor domain-containing protein [Mycena pura]|uniref:Fungal-specific transcription factor domain-containing protein n=1 Tax=Mycena pura TaxID=153505 RepID=A0AAD6Y1L6_9AGAR|nr:fungal-specific transcription factor domain-containing protein [Mycena pura]